MNARPLFSADHRIHHETVKALLDRYSLWRYPDFQRLIQYQAPSDPQKLRKEMVKLRQQGWTKSLMAVDKSHTEV